MVCKIVEGIRGLRESLIPSPVWGGKNAVSWSFIEKLKAEKLSGVPDATLLIFNTHDLDTAFGYWM